MSKSASNSFNIRDILTTTFEWCTVSFIGAMTASFTIGCLGKNNIGDFGEIPCIGSCLKFANGCGAKVSAKL